MFSAELHIQRYSLLKARTRRTRRGVIRSPQHSPTPGRDHTAQQQPSSVDHTSSQALNLRLLLLHILFPWRSCRLLTFFCHQVKTSALHVRRGFRHWSCSLVVASLFRNAALTKAAPVSKRSTPRGLWESRHDTMLASCRPVWDLSTSRTIFTTEQLLGSSETHIHGRPKLGLKRGYSHGRKDFFHDWLAKKQILLIQERGARCQSNRLRCRGFHLQGDFLGLNLVSRLGEVRRTSGRVWMSSCLAVTCTALGMKDMEQLKSDIGEQEINVGEREIMRRQRISLANKGKVPWNKGGKHSPETIKRIRERTMQAMNHPAVIAKLKMNPRHLQTEATRSKIRDKLRAKWDTKKSARGYQELMIKDWWFWVAEAARVGDEGQEELTWNSYKELREELRKASMAANRLRRSKRRQTVKVKQVGKSLEHRQKISEAIRAKWEDPEYQSKVRRGMKKSHEDSRPRRRSFTNKSNSSRAGTNGRSAAGIVIKPLDHGFVTAVMSGESRRNQKQTSGKQLQGKEADEPEISQVRFRNHKVDLLRMSTTTVDSREEDFGDLEDEMFTERISVSAAHTFVDPHASDKRLRLKQLQANRIEMDQRRKEAVERARLLFAEAERAAKALEAIAGDNESALLSLNETHRIMEEAAIFIKRAQCADRLIDGNNN